MELPPKTNSFMTSANQFTILKETGSGGYSTVYEVMDPSTQRKYALKKMDMGKLSKRNMENISKEIQSHSQLNHPNIIKFIDFLQQGNCIYLLLEFSENGTLFNYITKKNLTNEQACKIFVQMCLAVEYIHSQDYIHRDIKPENILLNQNMDSFLCDFGWCAHIKDISYRYQTAGTYEYMSPEALQNNLQTKSVDIWALGVLLYELYHNQEPFEGRTAKDVLNSIKNKKVEFFTDVPKEAIDLIVKILAIDADRRPSIREILSHPYIQTYYRGSIPPPTDGGTETHVHRTGASSYAPNFVTPPATTGNETQLQPQTQTQAAYNPLQVGFGRNPSNNSSSPSDKPNPLVLNTPVQPQSVINMPSNNPLMRGASPIKPFTTQRHPPTHPIRIPATQKGNDALRTLSNTSTNESLKREAERPAGVYNTPLQLHLKPANPMAQDLENRYSFKASQPRQQFHKRRSADSDLSGGSKVNGVEGTNQNFSKKPMRSTMYVSGGQVQNSVPIQPVVLYSNNTQQLGTPIRIPDQRASNDSRLARAVAQGGTVSPQHLNDSPVGKTGAAIRLTSADKTGFTNKLTSLRSLPGSISNHPNTGSGNTSSPNNLTSTSISPNRNFVQPSSEYSMSHRLIKANTLDLSNKLTRVQESKPIQINSKPTIGTLGVPTNRAGNHSFINSAADVKTISQPVVSIYGQQIRKSENSTFNKPSDLSNNRAFVSTMAKTGVHAYSQSSSPVKLGSTGKTVNGQKAFFGSPGLKPATTATGGSIAKRVLATQGSTNTQHMTSQKNRIYRQATLN